MTTLTVEIIAPEATLWRGAATALVAQSTEGNFTILAQHTAMAGELVSSVVRVESDDGEIAFAVHGGSFLVGRGDVEGETLAAVLAGVVERGSDIDVARAQAAQEAAQSRLAAAKGEDGAGELIAAAALERAQLRLRVATKQY